jgi:anti-sigma factor RsiW
MNETQFQSLLEAARVRALTPAEDAAVRAWLADHPAARAAWEEERRLDALLRGLPDLPVASNFTAQVLAAVAREATSESSQTPATPWWSPWLTWPRLAAAALALVAVVPFGVWQHRLQQRAQLAASVEALSAVPAVEILADFDAIARLSQLPANSDLGVLTALQAP